MNLNYKQFMKELETAKKLLSEAYMLNNDEHMEGAMPNYMDDEESYQDEDERELMTHGEEDLDDQDISRYDDRISKIREVAIQGLQDYAENVNDARYQFFKKIFLECDKACQEKNGGNVK